MERIKRNEQVHLLQWQVRHTPQIQDTRQDIRQDCYSHAAEDAARRDIRYLESSSKSLYHFTL